MQALGNRTKKNTRGITLMKRLLTAVCLMTVMGGMSLAASDEYVRSRQYRPHPGTEPEHAFFLIYIMDIDQVSAQNQSFTVNMYLRLRWKDERLAHSDPVARTVPLDEVWNPNLLLANQQGLLRKSLPEVVKVEPDGMLTYHQRYVGTISQPLHLHDFPCDTHSFAVQFMSASGKVAFLPDTFAAGSENIVGGTMAETLSLPDWKILNFEAKERPFRISADLQEPGFVFTFTAKRHFSYYLWQMILPQVLIVVMSWAAFWIDPSMAGTQIGLATTPMLTLIAHRFLLASQLPRLPYMTRMDNFIMLSTILVFAAFMEVVITSGLAHADRNELGKTIDRWSRLAFPPIFICVIGLSFWI